MTFRPGADSAPLPEQRLWGAPASRPTSSAGGEFSRGWTVLLASFLGMGVCISSLVFYSAGIWVRPWQEEFGWSRAEIGLGATFCTFALVLAAPFAGAVIDRLGLRGVVLGSLLLLALGMFGISRMNGSLAVFYGLSLFCGLVGVASSPLAFTRAINAWFDRNRGFALGLSLTSTGVAGIILPQLLAPYVATHGWRAGYFTLVVAIFVATPIIFMLLGRRHAAEAAGAAELEQERVAMRGTPLRGAARTREFWTIAAIFLLAAIGVGGLIPAFVPLLQDAGLGPEQAGRYGAIIGGAVIAGRLLTGFLIDRLFAGYVTAAAFLLVAAGLFTLAHGGLAYAAIGAAALGFAIGCEVDLIGYFCARYFGLTHYGVIYGVLYGLFQFGCGISPILVGHIWDITGSYDWALQGSAALLLVTSGLAATLPRFPDVRPTDRAS